MEYVRTLENKVRHYRNERGRFQALAFLIGFGAGVIGTVAFLVISR